MKSSACILLATAATAQQFISPYATMARAPMASPYGLGYGAPMMASPYGLAGRAPVASYGSYPAYAQAPAPVRYAAPAPVQQVRVAAPPVRVVAAPVVVEEVVEEKSNPMNMFLLYYLMSNDSVDVGGNSYKTYECDGAGANCKVDDGLDMMDIFMMQSMMKSGTMGFESLLWPTMNNKDKYIANKAGDGFLKTTDAVGINTNYGITSYSSKGKLDGLTTMMMFMASNGVMGGNLPNDDANNNLMLPLLLMGGL